MFAAVLRLLQVGARTLVQGRGYDHFCFDESSQNRHQNVSVNLGAHVDFKDFHLTTMAELWQTEDERHSSATMITSDQQDFALTMLANLHGLYKEEHLSDVVIVVAGQRFKSHRLILSAVSPYFKAMFSHDMVESRSLEIELKELSRSGFEIMIEFIYSGKMSLTMLNIHDAVSTASFLQVIKAMDQCILFLKSVMTFQNACDILHLADLYDVQSLKDHYRKMVLENFEEFANTDEFLELDADVLADYLQDDGLLTVTELNLLKIAERWYRYDPIKRRKHAYDVFEKIRYTLDGWPAIGYMENIDVFTMSKRCRELTDNSINVMQNPSRRHLCPSHQTRVRYKRKTLVQIGGVPDDFDAIGCSTNSFYHHDLKAWMPAGCIGYHEPKSHSVLVEVNDHGIMCGGYLYEGVSDLSLNGVSRMPTNEVKIIHPSGFGMWDMPYMNIPRVDFTVVHAAGYLVAVGGRNNQALLKSCERYQLEKEKWSFIRELPLPLMQHAGSAHNGRVYISGGVENGTKVIATFRCYDPATDSWVSRAPMNTARSFHGQCTIGDQILVCGGWSDYRPVRPLIDGAPSSRCLSSVESYNALTNQWTLVVPMRRECSSMGTVVFEGQMLVVGGEDHIGEISDQIHAYDPATNKWRAFAHLPLPLKNLSCCALTVNLTQAVFTDGKFFPDTDEDATNSEVEFVDWDELIEDLRYNFNDVL